MALPDSNFVTIVSGLPRSGTSLMMQMLAAGGMPVLTDEIRSPDADNPKGYLEFEAAKNVKKSPEWLLEAQGKAVKMVHLLLLDLPRQGYFYRVLLMKRNINEVLASQRTMLQRHGKSGAALGGEQLAQIFTTQMQRVESYMAEQPQFSFLSVNYNEMVADPAPLVKGINQFLGGTLDSEKMVQTVDSTLYRQRIAR